MGKHGSRRRFAILLQRIVVALEARDTPESLPGLDVVSTTPETKQSTSGVALAPELPYARVVLDQPVPHLDHPFDYSVPLSMHDDAVPGARVSVRFGAQKLNGYILERRADVEAGVSPIPLLKVLTPFPVLNPLVATAARAVADRYAGTLSDVLRAAVPPRVASVDKEFRTEAEVSKAVAGSRAASSSFDSSESAWRHYEGGPDFLAQLAAGESPRAVVTVLPQAAMDWTQLVTDALTATLASGRGATVVVPDARDLRLLETRLTEHEPAFDVARLNAEDGPTPRYRNFMSVALGRTNVAIGTRSAAFAPLKAPGLYVLWQDADQSLNEPRAPYQHAREVLLLRASLEGAGLLILSTSRSAESQRLVATKWALELAAPRDVRREFSPRIVVTGDDFEREKDPFLHASRLPRAAWTAAKDALEKGPVLIQVARTGFVPTTSCERCRAAASCKHCHGPLSLSHASAVPTCQWCGRVANAWSCDVCGSTKLRARAIGADRTAEELGRAFPKFPVVSATGAQPKYEVSDKPQLVVATPGAEPRAHGGYQAALLLDGDRSLMREGLRVSEEVVHRWFDAVSLVKSASEGGRVVIAASQTDATQALVRMDAPGFAWRELEQRRDVNLPPACRSAVLEGPARSTDEFVESLSLPETVSVLGPVAFENPGTSGDYLHRWLLFFTYADGPSVAKELKNAKIRSSTHRKPVVSVRVDDSRAL